MKPQAVLLLSQPRKSFNMASRGPNQAAFCTNQVRKSSLIPSHSFSKRFVQANVFGLNWLAGFTSLRIQNRCCGPMLRQDIAAQGERH